MTERSLEGQASQTSVKAELRRFLAKNDLTFPYKNDSMKRGYVISEFDLFFQ